MVRLLVQACACLFLAAGPAEAALVTHAFGGATFYGTFSYDTELPPLGRFAPPYDPAIGIEITFENDPTFGNAVGSTNDDWFFWVSLDTNFLSVAGSLSPAVDAPISLGLTGSSGSLFSDGQLPTSLSIDDLDEAFLRVPHLIGNQRVDVLLRIDTLHTVPEPTTGALVAAGLLVQGLRGRRAAPRRA